MKPGSAPTSEMMALLAQAGSDDSAKADAAQQELAIALTLPLRQGVLHGDTISSIFQPEDFLPGVPTEYPLDFLSPGSEGNFTAYTVPSVGRIPERTVEGDYVMVPTYEIGNSIDMPVKYIKQARWNVVARAMQVLEAGHVRKKNDDGWHVILAAAKGRNLTVYDDLATAGLFTKRLVSLMTNIMRRNAGGNSTSVGRGKLTDLFLSPEAVEDMRSWDLSQVDDETRRSIILSGDGMPMAGIWGVKFHVLDELGVGQAYQLYFSNTLAGTMATDKVEIVVGVDLSTNDSFHMPRREKLTVYPDPMFLRQRRQGWWSTEEVGFTQLDSRRSIVASM